MKQALVVIAIVLVAGLTYVISNVALHADTTKTQPTTEPHGILRVKVTTGDAAAQFQPRVTILSDQTNQSSTITTPDSTGYYVVNVAPGDFEVTAHASGYQDATQHISMLQSQIQTLNLILQK